MAKGYNRPMGGGGGMGNSGMMAQLRKMQEQMAAAQEELAVETVTSSVGGGAVKITMTGDQHCKGVEISPDLLKDADAEMLQDLILSGVNQALDDSRKMAEDKMAPLSGGLSGLGL
jgi:DNA-binding YbaB/EbfC family protein